MIHFTDCLLEFQFDLFIRNMNCLSVGIVSQVSQMNHQREYIVLSTEGNQIIGKAGGVYIDIYATDQFCNGFCENL